MADVNDVAAYIIARQGAMSTWKLQKLVYYSQAWHLVWSDTPLFDDRIQAWANGPVVKVLYNQHRGAFSVDAWPQGDVQRLSDDERQTIDLVLEGYGSLTGRQLSHLTHSELPWQSAREGLEPTQPGNREITTDSMLAYYQALDADPAVPTVETIDWTQF